MRLGAITPTRPDDRQVMSGRGWALGPPGCLLAVPFIHPGLAVAAAVAALIPLLIHLLNRKRARRVPWAAMSFLLAARRRSQRRIRFEQWLLLVVRTAILALFGLAVARPYLTDGAAFGLGQQLWHRVLVVDNSLSAVTPGVTEPVANRDAVPSAARAVPAADAALRLLASFPESDAVSVITLAPSAQQGVGRAAYDRRMLQAQLESIPATQGTTDLGIGLTEALTALEDSPAAPGNRAVYILSDQAAAMWRRNEQTAVAARSVADQAELIIVPTASEPRPNRALLSLTCLDALPAAGVPLRLQATVANYDEAPARDLTLHLHRDGQLVRRLPIEAVEPGGRREVVCSVALDTPGAHSIIGRLVGLSPDSQADDDARFLTLEVFESVPVLLVDGEPGRRGQAGQTRYLAAALAPQTTSGQSNLLAPRVIPEWELPSEALPDYRLIALCNVHQLAESTWQRLEAFAARGGGLLVFLGSAVAERGGAWQSYNRFGFKEGRGVLPARLAAPVGDPAAPEEYVRLSGDDLTHPAVAHFGGASGSGLFSSGRIYRYILAEADPTAAAVVLRYSDGRPAIIERSFGDGQVCLITTTANMAWNNLAARGDYLALVWGLASHVAGGLVTPRHLLVGESIDEPLSPVTAAAARSLTAGVRVSRPDSNPDSATLVATGAGYSLRYGPVDRAGIYRAETGREPLLYAANVPAAESDLRALDQTALRETLECPFTYLAAPGSGRPVFVGGSDEFARSVFYLVLLLLMCEAWLAMRFTSRG